VIVAGLVGSGGGGLTPMVIAAREGDMESTKLLLSAGADGHTARCWRHEETRREDAWPEQSYGSA